MAGLRRKRMLRQVRRNIQTVANVGRPEEFLGKLREVVGKIIDRIIAGIDGPDDGVHGSHRLARRR